MGAITTSCVYQSIREPEGFVRLYIVTPTTGVGAADGDTIVFDRSLFGIHRILSITGYCTDGITSYIGGQTITQSTSSNTVTVTLPTRLARNNWVIEVVGTSRLTHSTTGVPQFATKEA